MPRNSQRKHGMEVALARTLRDHAQRFAVSDILHKEYRKCAEPIIKGTCLKLEAHLGNKGLAIYYTNGTHIPPMRCILPQAHQARGDLLPDSGWRHILDICWVKQRQTARLQEFAMNMQRTPRWLFCFTKDMTVCMMISCGLWAA